MTFDDFRKKALLVEHVTDCRVRVIDGERGWEGSIEVLVEAYMAKDDGTVERGRAPCLLTKEQYDSGRYSPGAWLLQAFDRAIKDKHEGYTRYATPDEIAACKARKAAEA